MSAMDSLSRCGHGSSLDSGFLSDVLTSFAPQPTTFVGNTWSFLHRKVVLALQRVLHDTAVSWRAAALGHFTVCLIWG